LVSEEEGTWGRFPCQLALPELQPVVRPLDEEYQAEVNRFLSVQDGEISVDPSEASQVVLDDMIAQTLLMQGAVESGFLLSAEDLDLRLENLIQNIGGEEKFDEWLQNNNYSLDSFRSSLERSIMAAWMRDQILSDVPTSVPHVNIRQIFFLDRDQANQVLEELQSGRDFATTAAEIDPLSRGELGWVPRNFLPHKQIEEAAFTLQPGEFSQVIETSVGYHIIQVVAVDDERRLSPAAGLIWQEHALRDWISLQRELSNIQIFTLE